MRNIVEQDCPHCGRGNRMSVEETADETATAACVHCGAAIATVGQLHALFAQQALGLGATELRDDHVPVDGEFGEQPRR